MSELREILRQIDLEIESIKHQQGYAITARHDFIEKKMEILGAAYDKLAQIIGSDNTIAVLNRSMERMYDALQEPEKP